MVLYYNIVTSVKQVGYCSIINGLEAFKIIKRLKIKDAEL